MLLEIDLKGYILNIFKPKASLQKLVKSQAVTCRLRMQAFIRLFLITRWKRIAMHWVLIRNISFPYRKHMHQKVETACVNGSQIRKNVLISIYFCQNCCKSEDVWLGMDSFVSTTQHSSPPFIQCGYINIWERGRKGEENGQ